MSHGCGRPASSDCPFFFVPLPQRPSCAPGGAPHMGGACTGRAGALRHSTPRSAEAWRDIISGASRVRRCYADHRLHRLATWPSVCFRGAFLTWCCGLRRAEGWMDLAGTFAALLPDGAVHSWRTRCAMGGPETLRAGDQWVQGGEGGGGGDAGGQSSQINMHCPQTQHSRM